MTIIADNNLILEHLLTIRGNQDDNSERLDPIEVRLSSMEQTLGHFPTHFPSAKK